MSDDKTPEDALATAIMQTGGVEDWPTIQEAAEKIGASVASVRRWVQFGRLEGMLVDRAYRVNPDDLARFIRGRNGGEDASQAVLSQMVDANAVMGNMTKASMTQAASAHELLMKSVAPLSHGFLTQLKASQDIIKSLSDDNAALRAELRAYHESLKTDKIKEKELELKKENSKHAWGLANQGLPQVLALLSTRLAPQDSSYVDQGIAAWLQTITEEQAKKLHSTGAFTDAQVMEAVAMRTSGKAAPGQLSAWMRSFSNEQLQKLLGAGVLTKEQCVGLISYHEAAGKLSSPVTKAAPAPAAAPATAAPAAAPAPATAPTTAANDATPDKRHSISFDEAEAIQAFIQALLSCDDETIGLVLSKLTPAQINKIKGIQWT